MVFIIVKVIANGLKMYRKKKLTTIHMGKNWKHLSKKTIDRDGVVYQ